ncbi:MAG: hypothetical protein ABI678_17025, partial [Kofleriaceae bacterium]
MNKLAAVVVILAGTRAHAEVVRCSTGDADVHYHSEAFTQLSGDTGWFPASSPAQLRLTARLAGQTTVAMGLASTACWDGPMTAHVAGRAQAGMLDFAYGAELHLFAQVHTSVLGHQFDWSGEVPLPTDYLVGHTTTFDPTLLPGAAVDHASGSDTTSPITLLSTDLIGDYIGIPGISGGLHLDAVGALTTTYRTTEIGLGDGAITTVDGAVGIAAPATGFGAALDLAAAASGVVTYHPALTFNAGFNVKILGITVTNFTLYSLTVPLPQVDDAVVLGGERAHIGLPKAPLLAGAHADFATGSTQTLAVRNTGEAPLMIEGTSSTVGVTAALVTIAPGGDGVVTLIAPA